MKLRIAFPLLLSVILVSCQNWFYTEKDFSSVLKIDSHVHINSDDGVFEEAAAADSFLLITLNVDHPDPPDIRTQYNFAVKSATNHPGMVFYGPTFFFDTAGFGSDDWNKKVISQLDQEISENAVTVKVWKNIGMTVRDRSGKFIMIDDPRLNPVFEYIKSKNLPVTGHLGEPRNCWLPLIEMTVRSDSNYFARHPEYHMFLHPEYPSYEDQIRARDNFLRKNADLRFIGCHLGSLEWNVDSLAARLDRFPNMAVDMSARICHLQFQSAKDRYKIRNFCIKYQDRLLYGTDTGYDGGRNPEAFKKRIHDIWLDDWEYLATDLEMTSSKFDGKFYGLELPKRVVDKIYHENAVKWYKLKIE
jgi:predicted TIM-barrel fold metal-dependent hydrolase